jgi:iron complex outermembrane receptor protein
MEVSKESYIGGGAEIMGKLTESLAESLRVNSPICGKFSRQYVSPISVALLCAGVAAAALAAPGNAMAQVAAQADASAGSGLEEIVVTARRKEERAQTIPLSITVFSQGDIESKRLERINDLPRFVPSLSSTTLASDSNEAYGGVIRIRGLQGVVAYFADVPLGTIDYTSADGVVHGASQGFYFDLDNLEVLKGPQGTLFGKNSIGGLISIEPKRPTNNFEGYVEATFGNYNDREFEGAVNIPIIDDKLLVRVAGQSQQRDGYTKDLLTGKDYDNHNNYSWRVSITARPTDDFENYFVYDGYWQDSNGSSKILSFIDPGKVFGVIPLGPGLNIPLTLGNGPGLAGLQNPATATATAIAGITAGAFSFYPALKSVFAQQQAAGVRAVVGRSTPGIGKDYFYGFTDQATWNISDDLTLKNIAAARVFKQLTSSENSGTYLPILSLGDPINNTDWNDNSVQYTEEIQLQGKALHDKLEWVLGGFLEFDHPLGHTTQITTALGNQSYNHFYITNRSQAVYAHGIYDLSDYVSGLRFTAGYRYTWDYSSVQEQGTGGPKIIRNAAGAPTNCALVNFDNNCSAGSDAHYSSYGWNLSLDEQLTPDTLIYVRSGNAYRPGTTNPQAPPGFQELKPEHVTDVELGVKSDWDLFGVHARTNADIFHTSYKAIAVQETVNITDGGGKLRTVSVYQNAATAQIEGGELEATFIPVPGLEISPRGAYIYSEYGKFPNTLGPPGSNPPFGYLPKWQYSISGTYHLPLDSSLGDIALSATYYFVGHEYDTNSAPGTEIFPIVPSHNQLDISVDWTNVLGYTVDARFFMTNATDNTFITGGFPLYAQLGYSAFAYNEPRMFGFSLKYRFGGPSEPESAPTAYTPPPVVAPAPSVAKSYLVFFDFNKSDLTPQAVSIVNQAAANAGPAKVTQLTVTGHTDTVGSDAYNMRLSRRRAESVAAQLEKVGIPSSEISIVAKGKRDLLVPTADGVKEPQNRRVQIVYGGGATS